MRVAWTPISLHLVDGESVGFLFFLEGLWFVYLVWGEVGDGEKVGFFAAEWVGVYYNETGGVVWD